MTLTDRHNVPERVKPGPKPGPTRGIGTTFDAARWAHATGSTFAAASDVFACRAASIAKAFHKLFPDASTKGLYRK